MKILIRIHNTNDKEVPFRSIVELKGYTRHGLSKKQLFEWADDLAGSITRRSPIAIEFYGEKGGTDYVAIDTLITWLKESDPTITIKQIEVNMNLCWSCVHAPGCPVLETKIPIVKEDKVKQCEMFFSDDEVDGG